MFRKIALFCALLSVAGLAVSSVYAEVQNIKVSGDIQALAVYRDNYDMEDAQNLTGDHSATVAEDQDSMLASIARLRIDADLTDNVSACVRIANAREWQEVGTEAEDIVLDLANITLKEMLYSPLTVIIGRQELNYGNGLIVGYGLFHNLSGTFDYPDLSPFHGYDAIRAILDYDPWIINLVAAKMEEGDNDTNQEEDDDRDLYGVNLAYKFDQYDAEMEGYLFYKKDENYNLVIANIPSSDNNGRTFDVSDTYVVGTRGSVVPMENLTLGGEIAFQWGEIRDVQAGSDDLPKDRDREAMLAYVSGQYDFADVRFNPVVSMEYLYTSGEEYDNNGDFEQWAPIYRGKIMGTIRDCLETLYATNDPYDTSGFTNQNTIKASCGLDLGELVDGLSMDMSYLHYWFDEEPIPGVDDEVGGELNVTVTYDYTEDVQFALNSAIFFPGDYYKQVNNSVPIPTTGGSRTGLTNTITNRVANDEVVSVVGSCKVSF